MDLDALFGKDNSSVDTADEPETGPETDEVPDEGNSIGWKALVLFICGGLVITALVVAFMVWVIEGLVL